MSCLQPGVCTGPNKNGPTCEVCYLQERGDRYREALENIEATSPEGTAAHTIAHNALKR